MQSSTKQRGGRREGAGRKPSGPAPLVRKTITIAPDDIAFLATLDNNLSAAIRKAVALIKNS